VTVPQTIAFVCQPGEVAIKAVLLAASLRRWLPRSVRLVAGVPSPPEGVERLPDAVRELLERLEVTCAPIRNPVGDDYPIANKIACLGLGTEGTATTFLDSDMLCLAPLPDGAFPGAVNAKPADMLTWPADPGSWWAAYRLFGLEPPSRTVTASVAGVTMSPYFNSGVLTADDAPAFARLWAECCVRIDASPEVGDKRPHLDQIALSVAIARFGRGFTCLGEGLNFPAHLKPLPAAAPPVLCHYHWPEVIRREPPMRSAVAALCRERPALGDLLRGGGAAWQRVLDGARGAPGRAGAPSGRLLRVFSRRPRWGERAATPPEVVITGIPRSGTSLLCRLLDDLPDCLVINEPAEIFGPLTLCENPWWLATFYRDLRRRVLEGEEIENKVVDGHVVEDTSTSDQRVRYRPLVGRPDFLLGTKNTLVYMARLEQIRRALPEARIVVCVRHPADALASWKGSFPHLRDVPLQSFPVAYLDNPFLTGAQRERLRQIAATPSAARRRALLWAHLAEVADGHRDLAELVRYEDLVADPDSVVRSTVRAAGLAGRVSRSGRTLQPRSRRELLDQDDLDAIRDHCTGAAERLGYAI
jgi:hypothetical protein